MSLGLIFRVLMSLLSTSGSFSDFLWHYYHSRAHFQISHDSIMDALLHSLLWLLAAVCVFTRGLPWCIMQWDCLLHCCHCHFFFSDIRQFRWLLVLWGSLSSAWSILWWYCEAHMCVWGLGHARFYLQCVVVFGEAKTIQNSCSIPTVCLQSKPLETGGVEAPQSWVKPQPGAVCIYCLVHTLDVSVWHTQPGAVLLIMFLTEIEKSLLN